MILMCYIKINKYDYRVINHNGGNSRARFGSFGMNAEYEYYLYVHKKDYEYDFAKINGSL